MKKLLPLLLACVLCSANAESNKNFSGDLNASQLSILASVVVVWGSAETLSNAGTVVAESVEKVGDTITVVLKGASKASTTTLKLSSAALGKASLAAGTVVNVVTMSTGFALVVSGEVIAFFPNEAGKALLHRSSYTPKG